MQANLFSADAHTLGFYGTFEGRFNLLAFPNLGMYNLLEESRDKLGLVRVLSTFAGYLNSAGVSAGLSPVHVRVQVQRGSCTGPARLVYRARGSEILPHDVREY